MPFELTKNQKAAISDRNGTLLVAAAAGSGKTAILTRRLLDKLCSPNEEGDISEFLVVTFTKAATSELKARLYKMLSEYVKNNPRNLRARRQLSLIGLAKISTIHSFCLDIIRTNFEALSLPAQLRMGEDTEISVLERNILEGIISERYEKNNDNTLFLKAVEVLSGAKSDEKFIDSIIFLYKKLRSMPSPREHFLMFLEKYKEIENAEDIFDTEYGKLIKEDVKYEIGRAVGELDCLLKEISADEELSASFSGAINADIEYLGLTQKALDTGYGEVKKLSENFTAERTKPLRGYENHEYLEEIRKIRTKCINDIKAVFSRYFSASESTLRCAAGESYALLMEILGIIDELDEKFTVAKLEKGILDYNDLEQYALKLLVEDTGEFSGTFKRTALAKELSQDYKEIYVDEYQDTNMVQDLIFRAISTYDTEKNTETNRFLVGDVKQSIYRFRGAKPEIFSTYIKTFENVESDTDKKYTTHKLYLSNNFRCAESVINTVNQVFDKIMSDYTEDDRLVYSKIEDNKVNAPCELVLIDCKEIEHGDDEKISEEALYIASRVKEIAYNPKYLREDGKMYTYSDFAILARSANACAEEYRRAFRYAGIPFSSDTPEDFFALPEVLLLMCLFNCIDNPQRDIYTAGIMYSPVFGFTADELCKIRSVGKKMSFYNSVCLFAEQSEENGLKTKTAEFLETISRYRKMSRGTPTDILISTIFDELGILDLYSGKEIAKQKNLLRLYELSRAFEKTSFRGLSSFLEYLSDLSQGSTDTRGETQTDSVKFMSIHRSKGLEFPIVILSGALREFNLSDERETIIFSGKHGIGIKLRDTEDTKITENKKNLTSYNTPFREAIKSCERDDMLEEEKRLLYVAMTRARDRLIITARTNDAEKTLKRAAIKRRAGFSAYGKYSLTYFDFLYHSLTSAQFASLGKPFDDSISGNSSLICYKKELPCDFPSGIFERHRKSEEKETLSDEKLALYKEQLDSTKALPEYSGMLTKIPAKISVSQLKKGLLDEEVYVRMKPELKELPDFMLDKKEADGAERGSAAHIFMQFANYENIEKYGAEYEADRLLAKGFITKRMREIVNLDTISGFVKSELYLEVKNSKKQYRERRFNLKLPANEFSENSQAFPSDAFVLVQGVSDLYFENPDGTLTLVDFKTDRVSSENGAEILLDRHTNQLVYYKRAIEEITQKKVSRVYIYSFALRKEILVDI